MIHFLLSAAVLLLAVSVVLLSLGVQRLYKAMMCECVRLSDEVSRLRANLHETEKYECIVSMCLGGQRIPEP